MDFKKLRTIKDMAYNGDQTLLDRFSGNYSNEYYKQLMTIVTSLKFKKMKIDAEIKKEKVNITNRKLLNLMEKSFKIEQIITLIAMKIADDEMMYEKQNIADINTLNSIEKIYNSI